MKSGIRREGNIRIKAMCLFQNNGRVLASKGFDQEAHQHFYRVLGGTVNFFETGEQAVRREIREELGSEIEHLRLIDVVENLFFYEGERGHDIVFLYSGDLSKKELYQQDPIHIVEDTYAFDAEWVPTSDVLMDKVPLYPAFDYSKIFLR